MGQFLGKILEWSEYKTCWNEMKHKQAENGEGNNIIGYHVIVQNVAHYLYGNSDIDQRYSRKSNSCFQAIKHINTPWSLFLRDAKCSYE